MDLIKYEGKNVRIIDTDRNIWTGYVCAFIQKLDTDEELYDEIDIDVITGANGLTQGDLVSFSENEIQSIEVIE